MATNAAFTNHLHVTSDTALDQYVEDLIGSTISRLIGQRQIQHQDRDDWSQDLRMHLLDAVASHDPAKASWHTYASRIISRHVLKMLRIRTDHRRRNVSLQKIQRFGRDEDSEWDVPAPDPSERENHHNRVQRILVTLPDDAGSVATVLMERGSRNARSTLGWGKDRYYTAYHQLRTALSNAGLAPT